jgi:hypothetical protein
MSTSEEGISWGMTASTSPFRTLRLVTTWSNVLMIVVNPILAYANLVYTLTHLDQEWPISPTARGCLAVAHIVFSILAALFSRSAVESQLRKAGYEQRRSGVEFFLSWSNFVIFALWSAFIQWSRMRTPSVWRRDFVVVGTGLFLCWAMVSMALGPPLANARRIVPSYSEDCREIALAPAEDVGMRE